MNKEFITEFIEVYRQHPALWKIKSSEYINKNLKNLGYTALMEVCKKFNIPQSRDIVQKKIQSLRSTFRKEYKKVENSIRSGRGSDEVYTPNLWYFDLLMFIKDQEQPAQSVSNVPSPSTASTSGDREEGDDDDDAAILEDNESEIISETQVASPSASTTPSISTSFITEARRTAKTRKKEHTNEHRDFLKACTSALTSGNNEVLDDSDAFGTYVGKKLKSVKDNSQKMYAETLITQVLQRAVMSTLSENTVLTDQKTNMFWSNNQTNVVHASSCTNNDEPNTLPQYYSTFTNLN
ncbi:uncharacterized protein LOC116160017 [Photinus pyralis]|uniref:uncharacterized protein LOC116160017 n=1 Tax=Photinus pyralis TaxID=7054 RepID=UPI0012675BC0|nr:uncharacterized protein LOC116160017 [Photinus pyralis]